MIKKINEMPYINYSKNKVFDLELEKFKSEEMITYITDILNGTPRKDKYGNLIKLNSKNDRIDFVESMTKDLAFVNIVKSKLNPNELKLLNLVFYIVLKG